MKQVILDCVLAQFKFAGDVSILHAFCQTTSDIFFPLGQQPHAVWISYLDWRKLEIASVTSASSLLFGIRPVKYMVDGAGWK